MTGGIRKLLALASALAALSFAAPAAAATLYISEFSNGITPVNSSQPQVPPTPSLADQTVALSGSTNASAAFGSATHVVSLICDEGCSVSFGTAPTAATTNLLLQQGVTYLFGVAPGAKVAAIANAAGDIPGGSSTVSAVNLTKVGGSAIAIGQAAMAASLPVAIASNQSAVPISTSDPCTSAAKSSVAISVATATTTSLVAVSGSTVVYVCGFSMTIAPSATAADTALFEYGTGASCTSPTSLTGTFGNGDLTSAAPVAPVSYGGGAATVFKGAASAGICVVTAGTAVSVQGVLTYVQQ